MGSYDCDEMFDNGVFKMLHTEMSEYERNRICINWMHFPIIGNIESIN